MRKTATISDDMPIFTNQDKKEGFSCLSSFLTPYFKHFDAPYSLRFYSLVEAYCHKTCPKKAKHIIQIKYSLEKFPSNKHGAAKNCSAAFKFTKQD